MNEYDFSDSFWSFYFVPFMLSISIFIIFDGVFDSYAYNISIKGIQARLIGFVILVIALYLFYYVLIKIPKKIGGWLKVRKILKLLISSKFFYILVLTIFSIEIMIYLNINTYRIPIFIAFLILCVIFQIEFMKKFKTILFNES